MRKAKRPEAGRPGTPHLTWPQTRETPDDTLNMDAAPAFFSSPRPAPDLRIWESTLNMADDRRGLGDTPNMEPRRPALPRPGSPYLVSQRRPRLAVGYAPPLPVQKATLNMAANPHARPAPEVPVPEVPPAGGGSGSAAASGAPEASVRPSLRPSLGAIPTGQRRRR